MLWFLGSLLIVVWIVCLALKVTTGIIHVALIAGLILFVMGFFRGRHTTAAPYARKSRAAGAGTARRSA